MKSGGFQNYFHLELFNSEDEASAANGAHTRNEGGTSGRVRNGLELPAGLRGEWRECPEAGVVFPKTMG